jgi:hypothetical protein
MKYSSVEAAHALSAKSFNTGPRGLSVPLLVSGLRNPLLTSFAKSIAILGACLGMHTAAVNAQLLNPAPSPESDTNQLMTILVGWDFTGMTADEEASFMGMASPLTEEEVVQRLTPTQRQGREQSLRNFNDPDPESFARWLAANPLPPDLATQREQSIWMMAHLQEYGELQDQQRTQAQRDELQAAAQAILHPIAAQNTSPAQQHAIAHPEIKPKPVTVTVPITSAPAFFGGTNTLAILNPVKP